MSWWKLWLARVLAVAGALLVPASSLNAPRTAASQPPLVVGTNEVGPLPSANGGPRTSPIALAISGEVVGLAPNAAPPAVFVRAGTLEIPAMVSGRAYSASIPWSHPATMVSVTAHSGSVRFHGLVASMARLKRLSGGDGVVSDLEAPALRISAWSTALSVLSRVNLQGRDPVNDAEYEQSQEGMAGADLGWIAFLLDRYATGSRPLPQGFTTGHDVVLDQSALAEEIRKFGTPGKWEWTNTLYAHATAPLVPVRDPDAMPSVLQARYPGVRGELPINSAIVTLVRNGPGRHDLYQRVSTTNPGYSSEWLSDGTLQLKPNEPQVITTHDVTHFSPFNPVRIHWRNEAIRWRRITDGDDVDLWAFMRDWTISYPDQPNEAPTSSTGFEVLSAREFAGLVRLSAWTGIEGTRRTLPTMCIRTVDERDAMEACDTAIHRFDANGAGITEDVGPKVGDRMEPRAGGPGTTFNWSRYADGSLVLSYPNGATTRAWVTGGVQPGVDLVVARTTLSANGVTHFANNSVLSIVPAPSPTAQQAIGTWQSGMGEAFPLGYPVTQYIFKIARDAGGSGATINSDPRQPVRIPQAWSVVDGRIYDVRSMARMPSYPTSISLHVGDCVTAFAQGAEACSPTQVRYLRPLRRIGDRVYGIEELHVQNVLKAQGDTSAYPEITVSTRASYHRCIVGDCLASAGTSAGLGSIQSVPPRRPARKAWHDLVPRARD